MNLVAVLDGRFGWKSCMEFYSVVVFCWASTICADCDDPSTVSTKLERSHIESSLAHTFDKTTMPPQSRTTYDLEDHVVTVSSPEPTKVKKSVRINLDSNEMFLVPHIDDMTESEIVTIWYDRCDYDLMKQSFIPIIKKMMRGSKIEETDSETTRGLEYRTRDGALRRQHNKVHSIHAVLDEQERQMELGMHNINEIAEIYIGASQHCASAARELGEQDEEFVKYSDDSSDQPSGEGGKQKKKGAFRKIFGQVRRTSLSWRGSNHSLSERQAEVAPAAA